MVVSTYYDQAGNAFLGVAGGTSLFDKEGNQRVIGDYDFVVREGEPLVGKGLHSTKFSFDPPDVLILPYTSQWFWAEDSQLWPKIGRVNLEHTPTKDEMERLFILANVDATLAQHRFDLGM